MQSTIKSLLAAALFAYNNVQAATVSFSPLDSQVITGATFTLDIIGTDFVELAGGSIDLGFSTGLQLQSVTIDPYWDFFPDSGSSSEPGVWSGIAFDTFFNPPATGDFTIATIGLKALSADTASLSILHSSQFFSTDDVLSPSLLDASVSITSVPLPSSLWLLGSTLAFFGLLQGAIRRQRIEFSATACS